MDVYNFIVFFSVFDFVWQFETGLTILRASIELWNIQSIVYMWATTPSRDKRS